MANDIIVAPFSNSDIRDWPTAHFAHLVRLLYRDWPGRIVIVGTADQRERARQVVATDGVDRIINSCGELAWPQVMALVAGAACVIGNNSGICHLGASLDVPVVSVFGGSHPRTEWRPFGRYVTVISRAIACSPCHLDHGASCPYGKACLILIEPEIVAREVLRWATERGELSAA